MSGRMQRLAGALALFLAWNPAAAQPSSPAVPESVAAPVEWNPDPWLADLAEMRAAIETKYANLEYLLAEREFDLNGMFVRAEALLRTGRSDADAMMLFNRIVERIDDGHVRISWPRLASKSSENKVGAGSASRASLTPNSFCQARSYQPGIGGAGIGPSMAEYQPLVSGDLLPAGMVEAAGTRVGIIRIGFFAPNGSLSLCEQAVAALSIPVDRPCDEVCEDTIVTHAYRNLTRALEDRISRLEDAGVEVMIIDITGNGGGSEWTEVAARMVTQRPLKSARMGFVRGAHWERLWSAQAERLRVFAASAGEPDRARLLAWADDAERAQREAARRCPPDGDSACPWLGRAGYATGLVGQITAGEFSGKDWGVHIFNPSQHPYRDGVWDGPLIVLTDDETWSAAEQFAAVIQDNSAGLIVGSRTGGSGCGHTWGGTPTRLTNSGAVLKLPDCARFRADGSNEVRGIMPDLPIAWRANDGRTLRVRLLEASLPEAIARARVSHSRSTAAPPSP